MHLTSNAIKIFAHVEKHSKFYALIVKSKVLNSFQSEICTTLKTLALEDLIAKRTDLTVDPHLLASFYSYAIYGIILEWINGGFKHSSIFMAEQLLEIIKMKRGNL
ncbi:TetR-like C-terminal domain-containing protein [Anaerobacillus isosaccharinicus]|uniref:TetR-like C-terminal domain-containing protein n=1 Tax=Anaerobacillus isosaccharinicus TaxID=1532552 RepID=A0AC62A4R7_9BACI|nr:TetR-like C-terminal domain-containing protein [Anaerobacillus isosaccharinicus]